MMNFQPKILENQHFLILEGNLGFIGKIVIHCSETLRYCRINTGWQLIASAGK